MFAALAEIVYQGSDLTESYAASCVAATLLVPGCDHASLMLRRVSQDANGKVADIAAEVIERRGVPPSR